MPSVALRSSFVICLTSFITRSSPGASFTHSAKYFAGIAERKSGARIYGPHEQTEANPAQPRERLENGGAIRMDTPSGSNTNTR
jgi:hypothetical protein